MVEFLAGILVMSIVATIGQTIEDNGNYKGAVLCGPAIWAIILFGFIYRKVTEWFKYYNVMSVLADENDSLWAVPVDLTESFRLYLGWEFPMEYPSLKEAEEKHRYKSHLAALDMEKYKDKWNKNLCNSFNGSFYINKRYCPRIVWKQYPRVPVELIQKMKEEKEKTS